MASASSATDVSLTCHHMFVRTRFVGTVTRCAACEELCMILTEMRRCTVCDVYFHEGCFQKRMAVPIPHPESESVSPAPDATEATVAECVVGGHTHEFTWISIHFPTRCDVCRGFFAFGKKSALSCLECDAQVHEPCRHTLRESSVIVAEEQAAAAAERKDRISELSDAVSSEIMRLIVQFSAHHRHWALNAVNPLKIKQLSDEHSNVFHEACAALKSAALLDQRELGNVRRALRFAAAAYGLAYEGGHMTDVLGNILLRISSREKLRPKAENNNIAVMQVLGMPRSQLVHSRWGADVFEPSYVLILDDEAEWIVLAFRGSLSDQDFLTDACGYTTPFIEGSKAHQGMLAMLQRVLEDTALLDRLRSLRHVKPTYRVVVVGHSLGGALVGLFVARVLCEGILGTDGIQCGAVETAEDRQRKGLKRLLEPEASFLCDWLHGYAFGPPPVITMPLADRFDAVVTSVVLGMDVIPRLQLSSLDRLGSCLAAADAPKMPGISDGTEECFIQGTILQLVPAAPAAQKKSSADARGDRLLFIDRTSFLLRQIFVSPRHMFHDHLIDHYAIALASVAADLASSNGTVVPGPVEGSAVAL